MALLYAVGYVVLVDVTDMSRGTTRITLPFMGVLAAVLLPLLWRLRLPPRDLGLHLDDWRPAVREAGLATPALVVVVTIAKWALLQMAPAHVEDGVFFRFTKEASEMGSYAAAVMRSVGFNLLYVLLVVPLQEFVARGVLHNLFARTLQPVTSSVWPAVLLSNLLFALFHLHLSTGVAVGTFGLGVVLGVLYARRRSLVGVWLAHSVVGVWALSVVRIQPLLVEVWP